MSSSAILPPLHLDIVEGGTSSAYLDDMYWASNPNVNRHVADEAQIEECYEQLARQDAKWQKGLPQRIRWEMLDYRSCRPKVVCDIRVTSDAPVNLKQQRNKTLRRRLRVVRDKLGWMLHLRRVKQGEAEPISLKLSDHEHNLLMNHGVIPYKADERKLSCSELARVRAIRDGAATGRTHTEVNRSYRRLGAA